MARKDLPAAPQIIARSGISFDVAPSVLQRWNPAIRAAATDQASQENTISIFDPIGYDYWTGTGVTAKFVAAILRSIGPDQDVTVNMNSPGGDYFEGLAIYNILRAHGGKVTVRVVGIAASAASVIAMAGDEIQIGRAAFLMIHNTAIIAAGDRNDLRDAADWLEPFDQVAVDIYAARTGIDPTEIGQMLDVETWINGTDAVDQGFADGLLPADQIVEDKNKGASQAAIRRIDALMAKQGLPRSERRKLIQEIKSSTHDAAGDGTHDAAESGKPRAAREVATGEVASLSASFADVFTRR